MILMSSIKKKTLKLFLVLFLSTQFSKEDPFKSLKVFSLSHLQICFNVSKVVLNLKEHSVCVYVYTPKDVRTDQAFVFSVWICKSTDTTLKFVPIFLRCQHSRY